MERTDAKNNQEACKKTSGRLLEGGEREIKERQLEEDLTCDSGEGSSFINIQSCLIKNIFILV